MTKLIHLLVGVFCIFLVVPVFGQSLTLERLNTEINTAQYDEIAPCINRNGTVLYFTRLGYPVFDGTLVEGGVALHEQLSESAFQEKLRGIYSTIAGRPIQNPVNSSFNQDVWVAHITGDDFGEILHPAYPLNNALPNSISSFGVNDDEMIVINQFVEGGGMKKGFSKVFRKEDGSWTFPQPMQINNYHNSGSDVNITMSPDGRVIILAMEREDAVGRSDLYISFKESGNRWSTPKNMGAGVNSPWREATPHLSSDGKKLYYSSDRGYQSSGGSDIFVQTRMGEGWDNWSAPKRFKHPINSDAHDSHPYFNEVTGFLYFNSTRAGSSDIYRIQIETPKPKLIQEEPIVSKELEKVTDLDWKPMPVKNQTKKIVAKIETPTSVVPVSVDLTKEIITNMSLTAGTKIELAPIFFKQSTDIVLHKSYPDLARLSRFLRKNPSVRIRISGHTDNRGEEYLLYQLSEARAIAIKDFLVIKEDIETNRIETIGYGGSIPLNDNTNEKERRKNRRVEFEIIEVGSTSVGLQTTGQMRK